MKALNVTINSKSPYIFIAGTGGIGSGIFFKLEGNHTLGRNESREGRLLDWKDYCKLHIVFHYISVLLGADPEGKRFKVLPIGKVGNDDIGSKLLKQMANVGMDISHVKRVPGLSTLFSVCFQYPDGDGGNITANNNASGQVTPEDVDEAEPLFAQHERKGIVVALPEVPLESRKRLLRLGTQYDFFRAASFTSIEVAEAIKRKMMEMVDLIALNEDEARAIANIPYDDEKMPKELLDRCTAILTCYNPEMKIVVTFGSKGAYGYDHGRWGYAPCFFVEPVNTAGAGDAYLSGLIISAVVGLPFIRRNPEYPGFQYPSIEAAMDFAALLSSLKVTSKDTIRMETDADSLYQHAVRLGVKLSPKVSDLFRQKLNCIH